MLVTFALSVSNLKSDLKLDARFLYSLFIISVFYFMTSIFTFRKNGFKQNTVQDAECMLMQRK